jgi:hypothetical protein
MASAFALGMGQMPQIWPGENSSRIRPSYIPPKSDEETIIFIGINGGGETIAYRDCKRHL